MGSTPERFMPSEAYILADLSDARMARSGGRVGATGVNVPSGPDYRRACGRRWGARNSNEPNLALWGNSKREVRKPKRIRNANDRKRLPHEKRTQFRGIPPAGSGEPQNVKRTQFPRPPTGKDGCPECQTKPISPFWAQKRGWSRKTNPICRLRRRRRCTVGKSSARRCRRVPGLPSGKILR